MAKGLGLDIIAEGVENETQLRYLHTQGCRQVQGFIYSRPLSKRDLGAYLDDSGRRCATGRVGPGAVVAAG
jgi:EAL domain-containing protein (putative c-di-GMP-specific phosphodiesterase class I)